MRLIDTSASADVDMAWGIRTGENGENSDKRYDDEDNIRSELRDRIATKLERVVKTTSPGMTNCMLRVSCLAARHLNAQSISFARSLSFSCMHFPMQIL